LSSFPDSGQLVVEHGGCQILVCRSGAGFFAIENVCPHQGAPLLGGKVRGTAIFCPLHGVRFDLRSGRPSGKLTTCSVKTFSTTIVGDYLEILQELPNYV